MIKYLTLLLLCIQFSFISTKAQNTVSADVNTTAKTAILDNGLVRVFINNKGHVNSLKYKGHEVINSGNGGRFYFSYNDQDSYNELSPSSVQLVQHTDNIAEVVFSSTSGSIHVDQSFIVQKGVNGLYSYVVVNGASVDTRLREMRVVYRVDPDQFTYGFVTDSMQGVLPSVEIMQQVDNQSIMDATYPLPDGSIYTKYNWANYIDEDSVHGLMSDSIGIWAINPSNEYINGGPLRQELTVHTTNKTPLILQMLQGEHFGASATIFNRGDEKIYGPFFLYVNDGENRQEMIEDAQIQANTQRNLWPYDWMKNDLFPVSRTSVTGQLALPFGLSPDKVKVVLAAPGGNIYAQGNDYIFWSKTSTNGQFTIPNVRAGNYTLYAYATQGEITDQLEVNDIQVSGEKVNLGEMQWPVTKYEHLLFQIGEHNGKSDGYRMSDWNRAYGLYEIPPANMVYDIDVNSPDNDWYYAQTKEGTWTIKFNVYERYANGVNLTVSFAGATGSPELRVNMNDRFFENWDFGNDAAVYRSAVLGGRYQLKTVNIPASALRYGVNYLRLQLQNVGNRGGVMYDCIKLEAGDKLVPTYTAATDVSAVSSIQCYPNPAHHQVNFNFDLSNAGKVQLTVYNIQGKVVKQLINERFNVGKHVVTFNVESLPAGVYMYEFRNDKKVVSGKLVKQ